ncbi:hypothetical protein EON81_15665 [bacterium]|nr:MAG: hypothetical protein EON81_15665 [bacterium]
MNDVRAARRKLVTDRMVRSILGGAWPTFLACGMFYGLNPAFKHPEVLGLLGLFSVFAYYADSARPPSIRSFRELFKASVRVLQMILIPLLMIGLIVSGEWKKFFIGDSAAEQAFRCFRLTVAAFGFTNLAAFALALFILPSLALLDHWMLGQEENDQRVMS